ncbi:Secreted frizzled-related protein 5 [Aphelenchoides fujianensis]|nr:Secreted frizzled-related protein 5 [Aphelenchoides fujianensis]
MYVARDWDLLTTDRLEQPKCVQIPRNFSLCYGMQYDQMRLPNLLEHETLEEAIQQSDAWNSLVRLNCHADTKLFLCSVFAPVCLPEMDKHIQPCKSLCEAVQQGCESRMTTYGFSWPEMLDCGRFPADNDMCIRQPEVGEMRAEERAKTTRGGSQVKRACGSCAQVATYENLMDHFCRSSIVFKAKVRAMNASHLTVQRIQRVFKPAGLQRKSPQSIARTVQLTDAAHGEHDCQCPMAANGKSRPSNNVLIMSNDQRTGGVINARLVVPWQQEEGGQLPTLFIHSFLPDCRHSRAPFRKFRKVDCGALGREIRESALRKSAKFQHRP